MPNNRPWDIADLERDYPEIRNIKTSQIQMSSDRAWESIAS
jgi:hypothetical protein